MRGALTDEQQRAVNAVLMGRNVFLTGPGGVGKSFVLHTIISRLVESRRVVAVTATTGIASTHLPKASTFHSFMGLGLAREPIGKLLEKARYRRTAKRLLYTDVLVIDEISMADPLFFCLCDIVLRNVRGTKGAPSNLPFGGMQLVVCGDFFQLPPVPDSYVSTFWEVASLTGTEVGYRNQTRELYGRPADGIRHAFVFETASWEHCDFQFVELRKVQRQTDRNFIQALEEIRQGVPSASTVALFETRASARPSSEALNQMTKMFPLRRQVADVNFRKLNEVADRTGHRIEKFLAELTIDGRVFSSCSAEEQQALSKLAEDSPIEQELQLCIGAYVLMVCNDYREQGVWNGSAGTVVGFSPSGGPIVAFSPVGPDGQVSVQEIEVSRSTWDREDHRLGVRLCCSQTPLILGWAISIHKGQGMTLDRLFVSIGREIFECGMAYVALSRVRTLEGLFLERFDAKSIRCSAVVQQFYGQCRRFSEHPVPPRASHPSPHLSDNRNIPCPASSGVFGALVSSTAKASADWIAPLVSDRERVAKAILASRKRTHDEFDQTVGERNFLVQPLPSPLEPVQVIDLSEYADATDRISHSAANPSFGSIPVPSSSSLYDKVLKISSAFASGLTKKKFKM
eukprot:ANDGO_04542.mRNA.1 ATP-dependent DNA helicase PIF1